MRLHIKSNPDHYLPKLRERFGDGPVVWNDAKRGNMDADVQGDNGSD
jgi:hypothetical protein